MHLLIAVIFILSIIVFAEFYLAETKQLNEVRLVMIAIRYSATPFIIALILYTLVKKVRRYYVFLPAAVLAILNIVSIFAGIVFSINEAGEMVRGPLGYFPYIGVGVYSAVLVFFLVRQSNKRVTEIVPIVFLAFAFLSGLVLPFFIGKDHSKVFCLTISIALFVYYVFLMLQFTKKDALTGLFNRQAFYSSVESYRKDITAVIAYQAAGGGCGVARRCDITGFFFQYNGYIGFPEKLKDGTYRNSEAGTTPMVEMDMNDVYDLAKLDAKLKQINA